MQFKTTPLDIKQLKAHHILQDYAAVRENSFGHTKGNGNFHYLANNIYISSCAKPT